MAGTIHTGTSTKPVHGLFIAWLNEMINNYVVGFYDDAISNIIQLSFIRSHMLYLQEQFTQNGKTLVNFISVIPTDSVNMILMVHGLDGVPVFYNKTDIANIMEFTAEGRLHRFHENVVIPIYDATNTQTHELFIKFEDLFGVKSPMLKLKDLATGDIISTGNLDADYEGRYSGSYNVATAPFEDQPYYDLTNITNMVITADIPVLPNLNIRYKIPSNGTVSVVATELTTHYIQTNLDLDTVKVRFMQPTP